MLDALLRWDERIFRLLNGDWLNPILDHVLPFVTDAGNFTMLFVVAAVVIVVVRRLRGLRFVVLAVVSVVVADAIGTYVFKYSFLRARPCIALEDVRLLVGCTNLPLISLQSCRQCQCPGHPCHPLHAAVMATGDGIGHPGRVFPRLCRRPLSARCPGRHCVGYRRRPGALWGHELPVALPPQSRPSAAAFSPSKSGIARVAWTNCRSGPRDCRDGRFAET